MGWECKFEGGSSTWTCRAASEKGKRTTPKNTLNFDLSFAVGFLKWVGRHNYTSFVIVVCISCLIGCRIHKSPKHVIACLSMTQLAEKPNINFTAAQ